MTKPSDHAFNFEAVLIAATKDKNGYVVKLAIHPSDVPDNFVKDMVGTRYQLAGVKLKDDGTIEKKPQPRRDEVQHAALLCKNPMFWKFMHQKYPFFDENEGSAKVALRQDIGVTSRSELATSELARKKFHALVSEYEQWALHQ